MDRTTRDKKYRLEFEIGKLIKTFMDETHLSVKSVDINLRHMHCGLVSIEPAVNLTDIPILSIENSPEEPILATVNFQP